MKLLAFDFGASSGRGILGEIQDGRIHLEEIHRFPNDPVQFKNHIQWDILRLVHEIKQCLITCKNNQVELASIGIDTWGVDYGLIDVAGELLGNPYHYRDCRTEGMLDYCFSKIDKNLLIEKSGIDCVNYNTIYQLAAELHNKNGPIFRASQMLLMPDLLNYFLTGIMRSEYTIATTTQLYDYGEGIWNYEWIKQMGIPDHIFPSIIYPGQQVGVLNQSLVQELKINPCKVIAVGSHDTASAIAAIPAKSKDFIYIATGTWVMIGVETQSLTVNEVTKQYGLSNEGSASGAVNLIKNTMGLWLLQECKRQWNKEGIDIDFPQMIEAGQNAEIQTVINPDDPVFYSPTNMPDEIKKYCQRTDQQMPQTIGEMVLLIVEGIALRIQHTTKGLGLATGQDYDVIHMFGGGIQDELFCQTVADYTGKTIITGPREATAMGNIMLQAIGLGMIKNIEEGRIIVSNSIDVKAYNPKAVRNIEFKKKKFEQLITVDAYASLDSL